MSDYYRHFFIELDWGLPREVFVYKTTGMVGIQIEAHPGEKCLRCAQRVDDTKERLKKLGITHSWSGSELLLPMENFLLKAGQTYPSPQQVVDYLNLQEILWALCRVDFIIE